MVDNFDQRPIETAPDSRNAFSLGPRGSGRAARRSCTLRSRDLDLAHGRLLPVFADLSVGRAGDPGSHAAAAWYVQWLLLGNGHGRSRLSGALRHGGAP